MVPVLLLLLSQATAWWEFGHMLTAMVAVKTISDDVEFAANELNQVFNGNLTHGMTETLVESACYPDDLKTFHLLALNAWHFIDKPYNADGLLNIDVQSNGNSVWLIQNAMDTLQASKDLTFERSFMLKFLLHVVGDLHQPLHSSSLYNRMFPHGDLGGNLFPIEFNDEIKELHALWDSGIGHLTPDPPRPLSSDNMAMLDKLAEEFMQTFTQQDLSEELAITNTSIWAQEAYLTSKAYAYADIGVNERPSDDYLTSRYNIVQKQICLGGYRLAQLLTSVFGDSKKLPIA